MNELRNFSEFKCYTYSQRECTVIKNGMLKNYNFIVLYNVKTYEMRVSEFTDWKTMYFWNDTVGQREKNG